jgi:hypothetical protein
MKINFTDDDIGGNTLIPVGETVVTVTGSRGKNQSSRQSNGCHYNEGLSRQRG